MNKHKVEQRGIKPLKHRILISLFVIIIIIIFVILLYSHLIVHKDNRLTTQQSIANSMILIHGGEVEIRGSTIKLAPFYINRYPVTIKEYLQFAQAHNRKNNTENTELYSNFPVVNITYIEAEEYAKRLGQRLPTEAEWEMAAGRLDERIYPWGNTWNEKYINPLAKGPISVGSHIQGASPYGVEDMVGNVFHWTCSLYNPKDTNTLKLSEYLQSLPPPEYKGKMRIIKAGGWTYLPEWNQTTLRIYLNEEWSSHFIGFRCVKPVDPDDPNLKFEINNKKEYSTDDFDNNESLRQLLSYEMQPGRKLPTFMESSVKKIKKGAVVADVGAGIGFLTYILSEAVGKKGKVYAVDIDQDVLNFINTYIEKENIKNVITIKSKHDDTLIPKESCDEIYLLGTLRFVNNQDQKKFLESCYKGLKPSGKLIISDLKSSPNVKDMNFVSDTYNFELELQIQGIDEVEMIYRKVE